MILYTSAARCELGWQLVHLVATGADAADRLEADAPATPDPPRPALVLDTLSRQQH